VGDSYDAPPEGIRHEDARHDWQWRRTIRAHPQFHLIYRLVVGLVGLVIVVVGLILVPFPGPGWLIVLIGLAVLASEFAWAQRLLHLARRTLKAWNERIQPQPGWVKALVLVATVVAVGALFWLLFLVSGVPAILPDGIQEWLRKVPGLGD